MLSFTELNGTTGPGLGFWSFPVVGLRASGDDTKKCRTLFARQHLHYKGRPVSLRTSLIFMLKLSCRRKEFEAAQGLEECWLGFVGVKTCLKCRFRGAEIDG